MKPIILASSIADSGSVITKRYLNPGMRCLFVSTAAEGERGDKQWVEADKQGLIKGGLRLTEFTITGKSLSEIEDMIVSHDVIMVNGGNTFYLKQQIEQCQMEELLGAYVPEKKIYIGSSAGSIVIGPTIEPLRFMEDLAMAPKLKSTDGLNLVDITIMPHWASTLFKERYYKSKLADAYRKGLKLVLLNDDQYVVWQEGRFTIEDIHG